MLVVAVMNIGQSLKPRHQPLANSRSPLEAGTPRIRTSGGLEHAVVREKLHDPIQVMGVERLEEFIQPDENLSCHGSSLHGPTGSRLRRLVCVLLAAGHDAV